MPDIQVFRYELIGTREEFEEKFLEQDAPQLHEASLEMPAGAQLLGVGLSSRGLILWAAIDADDPVAVLRHFVVVGNGVTIPGMKSPTEAFDFHVATQKVPGGPTFHVFETTMVVA